MKNSRKNNFNGYCGENAALCPGKKMMPGSVSLKIRKITFSPWTWFLHLGMKQEQHECTLYNA